jgi:hypothetical protein
MTVRLSCITSIQSVIKVADSHLAGTSIAVAAEIMRARSSEMPREQLAEYVDRVDDVDRARGACIVREGAPAGEPQYVLTLTDIFSVDFLWAPNASSACHQRQRVVMRGCARGRREVRLTVVGIAASAFVSWLFTHWYYQKALASSAAKRGGRPPPTRWPERSTMGGRQRCSTRSPRVPLPHGPPGGSASTTR